MPEKSDEPEKLKEELAEVAEDLAGVVQRAMLEAADLQDIQARVKEVSERISKLTPPPEKPAESPAAGRDKSVNRQGKPRRRRKGVAAAEGLECRGSGDALEPDQAVKFAAVSDGPSGMRDQLPLGHAEGGKISRTQSMSSRDSPPKRGKVSWVISALSPWRTYARRLKSLSAVTRYLIVCSISQPPDDASGMGVSMS